MHYCSCWSGRKKGEERGKAQWKEGKKGEDEGKGEEVKGLWMERKGEYRIERRYDDKTIDMENMEKTRRK